MDTISGDDGSQSTSPEADTLHSRVRSDATIEALVRLDAHIDGDVIEVAAHLWAIHGTIPVDGEVILAEFGDLERAYAALDQLNRPAR